ncbi:MAG: SPOR domain-containing protein [Methylophilaceae bacterium]
MKRWLLLLCLATSPVLYAASAIVEGVKMPAWSEHDGVKTALTAGVRLENADIVTTGSGGRVALKLEDETSVKLGENAKLVLDNMVQGAGASYRAALSVPQGAFRLTTKPLYQKVAVEKRKKKHGKKKVKKSKQPQIDLRQHEFNVKLGTLTAVTQSVDIVGKSSGERDVIGLLKGEAQISHDDTSSVTLSRAKSYVDALNPGSLNAPAKAAAQDLQAWKTATDLTTGRGIASRNGRWKVSVGTFRDRAEADSLMHQLDEEGYAAEVVSANIGGKSQARLQIPRMKSNQDAAVVAERVRQQFDLDTVTVIR